MQILNGAFQTSLREDAEVGRVPPQKNAIAPAMRAGLAALEREFSDLMSRNRGNRKSQEIEQRIDIARRLLDFSEAR